MTPAEIQAANEELIKAYRQCFGSPAGKVVMADLIAFCRFRREATTPIEEGQRRVFLRIINMVCLTDEQLQSVYGGRDIGNIDGETE